MKFILTNELGRLARWLRILGFDAAFTPNKVRSELIIASLREDRIIVTRDSRMSPVSGIRILKIRYDNVKEQLAQLLRDLNIGLDDSALFSRCILCNEELKYIMKEKIKDKVPEYVYKTQQDFVICPRCNRVYWHGTHWGNVRKLLSEIKVSII
jgi:uncharacterized protein with PIN domain